MKNPSKVEVLNDINGELINLYRVIQHHLEEFIRQFRWALVSRQIYTWMQQTPEVILTDIQRAARFYYLQKLSFGARIEGQTFGASATRPPRFNLLRIEEDLSMAHLRLTNTTVENMDWASCITRYDRPHTLFYCDPPYWQTEGYGVAFPLENYTKLAGLARTIQGKMIISVNDIPEMREIFAGLVTETAEICYTVGGNNGKRQRELIIRN